ncbi:MAG TPA: fibronectin type III domain-containing protein [Terriglobales bacterium]|nr:fibronectin type III domain-containing protein [Terriglobales bacterium]
MAMLRGARWRAAWTGLVALGAAGGWAAAQGTGTLPQPSVSSPSATSVALSWSTAAGLNTQVWYGVHGASLSQHYANWKLVTAHSATLSGLAGGTSYDLRIESSNYSNPDLWSAVFSFTTGGGPPPVVSLGISPPSVSLQVGQSQTFVASYSDGSTPSAITWSASGGGTITAAGVYIASAVGSFRVSASDGLGQQASAGVAVAAAASSLPTTTGTGTLPLPTLASPDPSTLTLSWATSAALNTQVWYALHSGGGALHYAVWKLLTQHTATLTNLSAGASYDLRIESSNYSNPDLWSAVFTYTPASAPPPPALGVAPASAALTVGQSQTFAATYSDGSTPSGVSWAASGGGTITSGGVFTASAAGNFAVTATDSHGAQASATVSIAAAPTLGVAPASAALTVGQSQTFAATYSDGSTPSGVSWAASGGGSITSGGVFTASAAGNFAVTATDSHGAQASATVSIAAAAALTVAPPGLVLLAGETATLTAHYADGSVPATLSWTATNGGEVDAASGVFTAAAPGQYTVTATDANGVSGLGSVRVLTVEAPPTATACPGCFFTSPAAAWLYAGANPRWGSGRDLATLTAGWAPPDLNTNQAGFAMPVQHTNDSYGSTGFNDFNYGPGWRHDSASVPNPPGDVWTPSCGWLPPAQFGATGCFGSYDGKDFIIDDTTGNFYEMDQLYVNSQGQPINFGVNGYGSGLCGGAGETVCGVRGVFSGNLATSAPNLGGATAAGLVAGAGDIMPGELDCATCLNHTVLLVGSPDLINSATCDAFPTGKSGDGFNALPQAVLCEGGVLAWTGDWTQLDPATHSTAVIALARALQLYGGLIVDQGGAGHEGFSFYTDYDAPPDMTGAADLNVGLVVFYGTTTMQ